MAHCSTIRSDSDTSLGLNCIKMTEDDKIVKTGLGGVYLFLIQESIIYIK